MNLHDYLQVLRRGWWVIVAMTVLGGGAGVAASVLATPDYQASATVYVATVGTGTTSELQQGNVFAMQRVSTYADLAVTATVLRRAANTLDDADAATLRSSTVASARAETALIDIGASGSDPQTVADQANAVANALAAEVERLDAPAGAVSPVTINVVEPATVPEVAVSPQPRLNLLVGLVVGFVLGLAALIVRNVFDSRIRTVADVPRSAAVSTITSLPGSAVKGGRTVKRGQARIESFRVLRGSLQFGTGASGAIAISAITEAGDASAVARQLAAAIAEVGSRVLVVDADMAPVASRKGAQGAPALGLSDLLTRQSTLEESVRELGQNVDVITIGTRGAEAGQLLGTPLMRDLIAELKLRYEYVLLASAPLAERSEAAVVAAISDFTLLVVQSSDTTRGEFHLALERLAAVRVESVAVVVDNVRDVQQTAGAIAAE